MGALHPEIEPYAGGLLPAGDGSAIYWECCGNPNGRPVLYLHGGPGSGCTRGARRFFDPRKYRAILFDQRGCGRSVPLLNDRDELAVNTTHHLLRDIELLREHLAVESWAILGISWGTTLALAYAEAHPERVNAMVLACVTTTSRQEVEWITNDIRRVFPREWDALRAAIPRPLKDERIVDAYAKLLFDDDVAVRSAAADAWCAWEDTHVSLGAVRKPDARFRDSEYRLRFARFVTHYWRHAAFLKDGELLENVSALTHVPAALIHGRFDISSPLAIAWDLHKRWSASELLVVDDAGHGGGSLNSYVVEALDRLRQ